jgi:hypothetical protein
MSATTATATKLPPQLHGAGYMNPRDLPPQRHGAGYMDR